MAEALYLWRTPPPAVCFQVLPEQEAVDQNRLCKAGTHLCATLLIDNEKAQKQPAPAAGGEGGVMCVAAGIAKVSASPAGNSLVTPPGPQTLGF